MIMLACDLDNTMIYGKAENEKDYFPVEYIGGTVVTWISRKALAMLESLDKRIALVPVTARSIEEYRRIRIFERIVPPYAITSMGGVILKNGEIDKDWRGSREKTADPLKEKIERLYNKLKTNVHVSLMKIIDDV
jgi:hydroxymethylpyrimidine pyrophosphatase-like HAD family hydrolase